MVSLFILCSNSVSEAPAAPFHPPRPQGTAGPRGAEAPKGGCLGQGMGCWYGNEAELCWGHLLFETGQRHHSLTQLHPGTDSHWVSPESSHWDPVGSKPNRYSTPQAHWPLSCCEHCSPPPPHSRFSPLSAHHISHRFAFQVSDIKSIHLAHFAQKGRLLNGSFYLLCIPGL